MPHTKKKYPKEYKEAISRTAQQLARDIDDAVLKAYIKKEKMQSGKAICLKNIEFHRKKNKLRFKTGRLYKFQKWQYLSDDSIAVQVWEKESGIYDIDGYEYTIEISEENFKKYFREFI